MLNTKKKVCISTTAIIACIAVTLVSASLGTDYWIDSKPVRIVTEEIVDAAKNTGGTEDPDKFEGSVHFGLFTGEKVLNYGFGEEGRATQIKVMEMARAGIFNFGCWVATIIFAAFSIAWGLVSVGFALLNVGTRPIETMTGPIGLYLWNAFALFFTLLAAVMYLILYYLDMKENVMTPLEQKNRWTSKDRTILGYSFWFLVVSSACYLINFIIIYISGVKIKPLRYQASMKQASMDGVMMY